MGQKLAGKRYDGRRLGSFLHSLPAEALSRRGLSKQGALFTGANGGTILVRRVNPTSRATEGARGGSYRSAWNRHGGARGRHETSEDGTISMKAPPAVANDDQARGVSIQNAERRCRATNAKARSQGTYGNAGERVHRDRIGRSGRERIAAPPLAGSGRANGSGPVRVPAPGDGSRWKNARERAPRSPCSVEQVDGSVERRTPRTRSQYPEERTSIETPSVVASESGLGQWSSFKNRNALERAAIAGDSPVRVERAKILE